MIRSRANGSNKGLRAIVRATPLLPVLLLWGPQPRAELIAPLQFRNSAIPPFSRAERALLLSDQAIQEPGNLFEAG